MVIAVEPTRGTVWTQVPSGIAGFEPQFLERRPVR